MREERECILIKVLRVAEDKRRVVLDELMDESKGGVKVSRSIDG